MIVNNFNNIIIVLYFLIGILFGAYLLHKFHTFLKDFGDMLAIILLALFWPIGFLIYFDSARKCKKEEDDSDNA